MHACTILSQIASRARATINIGAAAGHFDGIETASVRWASIFHRREKIAQHSNGQPGLATARCRPPAQKCEDAAPAALVAHATSREMLHASPSAIDENVDRRFVRKAKIDYDSARRAARLCAQRRGLAARRTLRKGASAWANYRSVIFIIAGVNERSHREGRFHERCRHDKRAMELRPKEWRVS